MKTIFLSIILLFLMLPLSITYSQLLIEDFDYPEGDTLTSHGWSNHSGTGTYITIPASSLFYAGYPSSGIGNHVVLAGGSGSREDVNTGIAEQSGNGSTVYYSFLINAASASNTADYIIHIGDRASPTSFNLQSARVFIQNESGNLKFGISNTTTATMGATNFSYGTTYLVFVKYTINTGGADECKLWVFSTGVPLSEVEAGAPEVTNSSTSGQDIIDAIALRQGSLTYSTQIDGIRVSAIWDELVPVELNSFTVMAMGSDVLLNWSTVTELNNAGFDIQRSSEGNEFITIGFVPGHGTTTETMNYRFVDVNLSGGTFAYRIKQVDFNGTISYSDEVNVDVTAPVQFELSQNYPNPFNPSTTIKFSIPENLGVSLKIFNSLGQEVKTLINQNMELGLHTINFDASQLNSGIYFYKLEAGSYSEVKKMTLIK